MVTVLCSQASASDEGVTEVTPVERQNATFPCSSPHGAVRLCSQMAYVCVKVSRSLSSVQRASTSYQASPKVRKPVSAANRITSCLSH